MDKTIVDKVIKAITESECECFGLRKDDFNYNIGDTCNNSHELFQDPEYDENDEFVYPYCEDGIYKGYYDAGELDGACAIIIYNDDTERDIINKLEKMKMYCADNLYLIAGNSCQIGNDKEEIIIKNAIVLEKF